jgi:hypothetical protein
MTVSPADLPDRALISDLLTERGFIPRVLVEAAKGSGGVCDDTARGPSHGADRTKRSAGDWRRRSSIDLVCLHFGHQTVPVGGLPVPVEAIPERRHAHQAS